MLLQPVPQASILAGGLTEVTPVHSRDARYVENLVVLIPWTERLARVKTVLSNNQLLNATSENKSAVQPHEHRVLRP